MLSRLPDDFTALVTGASGGIGSAVIDALLESDRPGRVIGVSRSGCSRFDPRFESLALDVTETKGLAALEEALDAVPLHLVFNSVGMLHDEPLGIGPEKKLDDLDAEALSRLYHVNAVTPALLLKALQPNLKGKHPVTIASLSARVGSISDNRMGGWYAYRASKAAHNMLMKTAAVELRRLNSQISIACLHPGTTDTPLSKPFQARVPADKLFTAAFVAERLLTVLEGCGPENSGAFLDWAGEGVPW